MPNHTLGNINIWYGLAATLEYQPNHTPPKNIIGYGLIHEKVKSNEDTVWCSKLYTQGVVWRVGYG